jgi:CheY-like chemotaxis protein
MVLTRQLVELMRGRIDVDSEPGRGTAVRVEMPVPLYESSPRATPLPGLPPSVAESGTAPLGDAAPQGVVLYIEDNPVNLLIVEQLLARWPGVKMLQATDAARGIELARSEQPDLVLLDMHLPDMDGPQVLEALQADALTRDLRVVILSAAAMTEDVEHARSRGAIDYWTKPLDFERFLTDVRALLSATRVAR